MTDKERKDWLTVFIGKLEYEIDYTDSRFTSQDIDNLVAMNNKIVELEEHQSE